MSETPASPTPASNAGVGLSQAELDALLGKPAAAAAEGAAPVSAEGTPSLAQPAVAMSAPSQSPNATATSTPSPSAEPQTPSAKPFEAPDFDAAGDQGELSGLELLDDVDLCVEVELGRTEMYIEDVLRLGVGSVIELDRLAGDPVDVYVNKRLVARGEVLVLNDNFCVRVNDIVSPVPELEKAR
ncbi:MAG: flagellar motor switch protein FliN [Phycisphaerae bacterium]